MVTVLNVGLTESAMRVIHQSPTMKILSGGKVARKELGCQCHAEAVHVRCPPDIRSKPAIQSHEGLGQMKSGPHGMHPISVMMVRMSF